MHKCDVVIVGAGVVGLNLALGLAKQSLSVALVDKGPAPDIIEQTSETTKNASFSPRVSAINAASQQFLESIGSWQNISRMQAYSKMDVWDQDGFGHIYFDAKELMASPEANTERSAASLGHIIENTQLNSAAYAALLACDNVHMLFDQDIKKIYTNDTAAHLELSEQSLIEAKLLLGADGANSRVRNEFGFKLNFWDYDQLAIVANVNTELAHQNTARQAFTPFGPLAFLPLPNPNQSSIVFSQQTVQAETLLSMSESEFEKALRIAIDNRYGHVNLSTPRFNFPLRMQYSKTWTTNRVAILGDAAHTFHPLAGQGANLGIADVECLLGVINSNPKNYYTASVLRKYERQRKAQAVKVIASMEGFKQLFDGQHPLKKLIRNVGLRGANQLPGLKQFFLEQAVG